MNIAFSIRLRYALQECTVCACACVCVCVFLCKCILARVCRVSAESNFDSERISRFSHHHFPNLKCTETRSKNYNRLRISADRRSFKFRHSAEARNIILMIYDIVECSDRSDKTHSSAQRSTTYESKYYMYIYHTISN